ncbi:MAG: class I SAM-dependent methyltransferase [Oscillospiraceae bacterium]|nr:class I SAM-dependent methyltransferase [Oscillospiraceae bacterium]
MQDSKERFTPHVENYVRYRPGYPAEAVDCLVQTCGLAQGCAVADIGAGTGKLSRLLLARGLTVFAVEPNAAMRAAAEEALGKIPGFYSVAAPAEDTGLRAATIDCVTAAQAFHWFDPVQFRAECRRILKPGGKVALVWNQRDVADPFMQTYEAILQAHHNETPNQTAKELNEVVFAHFFAGGYQTHRFTSFQSFDYEGLLGRVLSSSYAPLPGHPQHNPLKAALRALFEQHQQNGQVRFAYDTKVFVGTP